MTQNSDLSAASIQQFESLIRRDPARRGLISTDEKLGPLCSGHLAMAAADLAETAKKVGIVTGFYIPHGHPAAAETDGPAGAMLLASVLREAGVDCVAITDPFCFDAVQSAAAACDFPAADVLNCPLDCEAWADEFFTSAFGQELTHLIAVERVGPSHTVESFANQTRPGVAPHDLFERQSPVESRNHAHNMRGHAIDAQSGNIHILFECLTKYRSTAHSIGVGDGGNEIGMGIVPWEELASRLSGDSAGKIPCRVATDWNIIAGTSNWGAAALAAGFAVLRGQPTLLRGWTAERQLAMLEQMIDKGPAVDGVTGRREATVDGLPFETYIQPWQGILHELNLL